MSLPNLIPDCPDERKALFRGLNSYTPSYEDQFIEWESIRSKASEQMVRTEECLLRVEDFQRRTGTRFERSLSFFDLERKLIYMKFIQAVCSEILALSPDFTEDGDKQRLNFGVKLRRNTAILQYFVNEVDKIFVLDARPPSVLDRLRAVRDDVGRALSSFARRFVPRARGTVVPFDGPS